MLISSDYLSKDSINFLKWGPGMFLRQYECGVITMKAKLNSLFHNDLFKVLMNAVFAHAAFSMVIIAILQVPPEAILDTNLREILAIFED